MDLGQGVLCKPFVTKVLQLLWFAVSWQRGSQNRCNFLVNSL
jgi:hypothetical protein